MSALASRLSKLEAAAGVGLSPEEQLDRLVDSQSDGMLLSVLAYIRALKAGAEPADTPVEVVRLTERIVDLIAAAG